MEQERKPTQDIIKELMGRLIIKLEINEIACTTCKGLTFVYKQFEGKEYGSINSCTDCFNGKNYVCKHCSKSNKTDHCECKNAKEERRLEQEQNDYKKEQALFEKAEKIKFEDYDGKFIIDGYSYIQDADDVYSWLYDKIKYEKLSDEELPKYLWSARAEPVFSLDIYDIINDKTEDGYEDMYERLDTNDEELVKAQEHLDKWYEKQGDMVNTYYENSEVAVVLDDLIQEIRNKVENVKGDK